MHFALITAPTITEFRSDEEIQSKAVQEAALQPQLGILSVAAIIEQWGDRPHLLDVNAEYLKFAEGTGTDRIDDFAHHMAEVAIRSNADVYGFSSICSTFPLSLRVARSVKRLRPYATVLFGGPQVSVVDQSVMQRFPCVDFVLRGEVEESLPLFLRELSGEYNYSNVPGLTYRDGGVVQRTANAPAIENLDTLLPPSYHLSDYLRGAKAASIELGRGCPFSCTFCSTNDFFRRRFRLRSPECVLADMRAIAGKYGIRHFDLVHDMFTVDRKRVVAFCEVMRSSGENFTWDCSARTDCVDEELLKEMAASGCAGLFFGIESGSKRVQMIIDKDLDPAKAEEMLRVSERLGLRTTASLIVGFPQEEWADVEETLRVYVQSARCSRSRPQLNLLAPLANTPLHTQNADKLILDEYCSDMSHQGLSQAADDLELIRKYPDIFPNFYMIPTPLLDRNVLFELREFLGMAVEHFRWLFCAIAQRTNLLRFHREWMHWRESRHGTGAPGAVRRYYAVETSRLDFLSFVRASDLSADSIIATLLTVEDVLLSARNSSRNGAGEEPSAKQAGRNLQLAAEVRLVALEYDLDGLMRALSSGTAAVAKQSFYATRARGDGQIVLNEISPFLSDILDLCRLQPSAMIESRLRSEFGLSMEDDVSGMVSALTDSLREDSWVR